METEALSIQNTGLALSLLLVLSCMILLWLERLKIQGEIVSGTLRSFIQLVILGYVIEFVFELDRMIWVLAMIAVMILAGAHTAKRRARGLGRPWRVCIVSLLAGTIFSLGVLFAFGIVSLKGRYLIPLAGIVIGNAVRTLSISLDRLWGEFKNRRNEIEAALALGASAHEAAKFSRWAALRAALIPSIDGMKIIGLVQMPGAMLGMLMAGASPLEAVKLQIVVLYLILASSTFTVVLGVEMACRARFTPAQQLKM